MLDYLIQFAYFFILFLEYFLQLIKIIQKCRKDYV